MSQPPRIVSLLPSATEIVHYLGLDDQLVGISHCCDYPANVTHLPRVTSTSVPKEADSQTIDDYVREYLGDNQALYDVDWDLLTELKPDIIVSQALCDVCAVSGEELEQNLCRLPGQPQLVNMEPSTLDEVLDCVQLMGDVCGITAQSDAVVQSLKQRLDHVRLQASQFDDRPPRIAMLEWLMPPFIGGHWNPEIIELIGGIDVFEHRGKVSHGVNWQYVLDASPDILVIACCGYDLEGTTRDYEQIKDLPEFQPIRDQVKDRILLFDGNALFNRPSPHVVDTAEQLQQTVKICLEI